ncbi:hypothetical protein EYZ11_013434 [Aspergillus tanneri]|uniref:Uncharacterized protein n=1 Tax=Aspergillus tanneri TaxID=1220188 RepID=A0A4S3IXN2_9EURO|nr:hypothetical protein EYZ11_013434 [Aspergillus tanneri]
MPASTITSSLSGATDTAHDGNSNGSSPTSSPLLFFVALGFGVVFTNLCCAMKRRESPSI